MIKKVSILAVFSLLTALNINAENTEAKADASAAAVNNAVAATDSINGDDFNVTFKRLNERSWQAILTNSTKPFNIVVDDSEWLRELYVYEGYATRNDTLFVQLSGGYEFATNNAEWKSVLAGQKVVLTEIRSNQGRTTKSYYSLTALEDDQVQYYAAHKPSAKPKVNRRANASTPAPTKDTIEIVN